MLLAHAALTWFLTGLIWFVQLVHYPLFSRVGPDAFVPYELEHSRRTGWLVGPIMVAEAAAALWLLLSPPQAPLAGLCAQAGATLLAGIWASTFLLQTPAHARLCQAWDPAAWRRLTVTNWLRTVGWTARSLLAAALLRLAA